MAYNVAVDVGGTFTDVIFFDESTGELTEGKVLTTPDDPARGVVGGIESLCRKVGVGFTDLNLLFHGTTVVTNAILTNTGSRVGLLTTAGHEDNLLLARAWTPGPLYGWMFLEKPDPPADPTDTVGINERIAADGSVLAELDEAEVREAVERLVERGVEAITISFMNSYLNPEHERRAREVVREVAPEMAVSISSEIGQEYGEYERTLTTVMNTAVQPITRIYMRSFERSIREKEFSGNLSIVRSDGGAMSTEAVAERPIQIALSGPSGGVTGSAYLARTIGVPDVLTFDMGGTSTDVSLCLGGEALVQRQIQLGYFQFKVPSADVHSVGAGGGSIAFVSTSGALMVGPMSAGADPGPACYGQGGEAPTVTDANVVLHRLSPDARLGGELALDEEAARRAVQSVADQLGMSVEEAAEAILEIVNENMHAALRVVSVERGHDPREFGLVAFGGAGPMHANALARLIRSKPVVVPPTPGVMSAFGFLSSDIQNEFPETYLRLAEETSCADLRERVDSLIAQADEWLAGEGVAKDDRVFDLYADCRYYMQNIQIPCAFSVEDLDGPDCTFLRAGFEEAHRQRYNFELADSPLEIATIRVVGRGKIKGVSLTESEDGHGLDPSAALIRTEPVYFGGWQDTPVYDREKLLPSNVVSGPAIVVQPDTTTVIEPGYRGTVDRFGNIRIEEA
ncbi:N-methylhydantoinase A/acetone carboxylase beta subunit [Rubrobacter radiotolerans]|uniref:Hydantoinase/oxoprolinase family protein n=1 Tax=Rubrobacter radiotolerans TaxID=42256 RepID=A0A023X3H4_RUBRA|nr:hydantoinase/oxoprolinase family protein [Rubrobacter radiotolerans]AHY46903.1 N-methylhydantoinase A/acetone carboxylase beta subunit [Rubrobacter radiotolerans]MDX5894308.1 hydantoinase/oxoprolinase family protein [Rubrobacter radiotolerans]SMC05696.1 N-methylhydantoinase A [Rubrobacter radiotolerans DSM 5868]